MYEGGRVRDENEGREMRNERAVLRVEGRRVVGYTKCYLNIFKCFTNKAKCLAE